MRVSRRVTLGVLVAIFGVALFVVGERNLMDCRSLAGMTSQTLSEQANCEPFRYMRLGGGGLVGIGSIAVLSDLLRVSTDSSDRGTGGEANEKPGTFRERLVYKLGIVFSFVLLPTSAFGVIGLFSTSTSQSAGIALLSLLWTFVPVSALVYFVRELRSLSYESSSGDTADDRQTPQKADGAVGSQMGGLFVYNARFEDAVYRVRCRTGNDVVFKTRATIDAGDEVRLDDLPATTPFELTITVKDGPTKSEVFQTAPADPREVVLRIEEDDVVITRPNLKAET